MCIICISTYEEQNAKIQYSMHVVCVAAQQSNMSSSYAGQNK